MSGMSFTSAVYTDVGKRRTNNEDNFSLSGESLPHEKYGSNHSIISAQDDWIVTGVFDGIGGEQNGEVASEICAQVLSKYYSTIAIRGFEGVEQYVAEANQKICGIMREENLRMGSTMVLLSIRGEKCRVYNIGDSRAYLFRKGRAYRLTSDHTVAASLIACGVLTEEQAAMDIRRHQLTQNIGIFAEEMIIQPTAGPEINLKNGDALLLCSDGVTDALPDSCLAEIFSRNLPAEVLAKTAAVTAMNRGSSDNVTALVVCCNKPNFWKNIRKLDSDETI